MKMCNPMLVSPTEHTSEPKTIRSMYFSLIFFLFIATFYREEKSLNNSSWLTIFFSNFLTQVYFFLDFGL
ncbi:hypothetical protein BY458DRAFT_505510 [Sporodiniella umbellata]|nr:hypothetical protein BY458DRAFT_505510 [Sporodiniella umbellata]